MSQTAYAVKVEEAFSFLQNANSKKFKDVASLQKSLEEMGGTTVDLLSQATWEDIEDGLGVPRLIARGLANLFRDTSLSNEIAEKIMLHKSITNWPVEMILTKLDPTKPKSPEAIELTRRFSNYPIIVFHEDGSFDFNATMQRIAAAERDDPKLDFVTLEGGVVANVYAIGYGPFRLKDACPLHPDTPLVDGRCHKCQLEWSKLTKINRQLLYFVMKKGFVKPDDRAAVHTMYDSLMTQDSNGMTDFLNRRYPEAAKAYNDAKARDEVPGLTLDVGVNGGSNDKDDPFGGKNKAY